jgi:hypothetical protein
MLQKKLHLCPFLYLLWLLLNTSDISWGRTYKILSKGILHKSGSQHAMPSNLSINLFNFFFSGFSAFDIDNPLGSQFKPILGPHKVRALF